jgi:hypothetical protein
VVENSTWAPEDGVYKLQTCPTGYSKISVANEWDQQKCQPCAAGTECVLEVCSTCSECEPGSYKDASGTQSCRVCPPNTYNDEAGATAFANCGACPSGAETGGREGMTSLDNCTCPIRTYLTISAGTSACKLCPKGGECCTHPQAHVQTRTRKRACKHAQHCPTTPSVSNTTPLNLSCTHTHANKQTHKHAHRNTHTRKRTYTQTHARAHTHAQVSVRIGIWVAGSEQALLPAPSWENGFETSLQMNTLWSVVRWDTN